MTTHSIAHRKPLVLAGMLFASLLASAASRATGLDSETQPREQIGESLGKPVYRDEIRTGKNVILPGELHRLFTSAAIEEYRSQHEKEITPTPSEISAAIEFNNERHRVRMEKEGPALHEKLKAIEVELSEAELTEERQAKLLSDKRYLEKLQRPPGELFAAWTMKHWKFQQHLYKKFGGGRLLWQQAGTEAFDATRRWLESLESAGKFKITDAKLRSTLYRYWTRDHGHWLIDDEERIQSFIEPKFLKASHSPKSNEESPFRAKP